MLILSPKTLLINPPTHHAILSPASLQNDQQAHMQIDTLMKV
jgi:hypothetical protein